MSRDAAVPSHLSPLHMILAGAAESPGTTAFLRPAGGGLEPITRAEMALAVHEIAAGLIAAGCEPGDRVLLLSETRLEWGLADLGTLAAGAADVPLYPSSLAPQVHHAWADSGSTIAFVATREHLAILRAAVRDCAAPRLVVAFTAKAARDGVITLAELRAQGRRHLASHPDAVRERIGAITADTLASIVYTSGTTGTPKGVCLTHGNLAHNVAAMGVPFPVGPGDVALSFLPLSHVLERTAGLYGFLVKGVAIAYARSVAALPQDLLRVRPTVLVAVPRVFQKLRDRVFETVRSSPWWRRWLFGFAWRSGRAWSRRVEAGRRVPWWLRCARAIGDRLVFRRLRARLGGRLATVFCGGAPLGAQLGRFFHAAGLLIYEGYGLTETSPVIAVNTPTAWRFGTVGRPLPNVEVRCAQDGEVQVRGPSVTPGYHGLPRETAELFTDDGWMCTGDLGRIDAEGFLSITGRKKELIVTSGGKKVAPGPIEDALRAHPLVAEAVVCGDGQPYLTALIVPEFEALRRAMPEVSAMAPDDDAALCACAAVRERLAQVIAATQRDRPRFSRIRRFWLLPRPFTEAGGELTPTQKVRRSVVLVTNARVLQDLYAGRGTEVEAPANDRASADAPSAI